MRQQCGLSSRCGDDPTLAQWVLSSNLRGLDGELDQKNRLGIRQVLVFCSKVAGRCLNDRVCRHVRGEGYNVGQRGVDVIGYDRCVGF